MYWKEFKSLPDITPVDEELSTQKIYDVPWTERTSKGLLGVEVLAQTGNWSDVIEKSGDTKESFLKKFMGQEKCRVASAKELYAAFGEKKQRVDSMAVVPIPSAEASNVGDLPISGRVPYSVEKDAQVSMDEPDGRGSRIMLGEGAYVYLEPSALTGKLGSLTLNGDDAWLGEAETSARGSVAYSKRLKI